MPCQRLNLKGAEGNHFLKRDPQPTRLTNKNPTKEVQRAYLGYAKTLAMCFVNEGDKRWKPRSSEDQVEKGVEHIAKIVVPIVEIEECTSEHNDFQLEILPVEVEFLTNQTWKARVGVGFTMKYFKQKKCFGRLQGRTNPSY